LIQPAISSAFPLHGTGELRIKKLALLGVSLSLPASSNGFEPLRVIQVNHVYLTDFGQNQAVSSKELLGD
jgi:hypothetical protein